MTFDPDTWDDILAKAARNVEAADRRFRASREGMPVDTVVYELGIFGPLVDLDDDNLRAYAEAVSAGRPYPLYIS
ncbi:hypothetical protein RAC69_08685 [Microbacterium sp. LS_15]|uniref:hypothetical protein n=1 Tax=Microbacterium sp. LS_15 TaxID=3055790 RepID=UPI0035BFBBA8